MKAGTDRRPPSAGDPRPADRSGSDAGELLSLLARADRLTDVLPRLHQFAVETTGGSCSLLFQHNPRNGVLQATSGCGLDELRMDAWLPLDAEATAVSEAFTRRAVTLVADLGPQMPELAARLGTPSAMLLPLARDQERLGLLAVGFRRLPARAPAREAEAIANAFLAALALFRLRQNEALQRDVRELLDQFSETVSQAMNVTIGLDAFCHRANRLFGADRTSVWIHDRRARHLVLQASSDA